MTVVVDAFAGRTLYRIGSATWAALGHPIYDCLYLAVAIRHQTHVITADRRFAAIGDRPEMSGRVRLLGA